MIYILLSILLFSLNNVLWKKNLEYLNTIYLISYRSLFTFLLSIILAFYFNSFTSVTPLIFAKVTIGSVLGFIGLLCMLTVIKKASLHWLGIYNLIGILFTTCYLIFVEHLEFKQSLVGVFLILTGFIYHIFQKNNINLKMSISQHLLMLIMIASFSASSIIHWKNLTIKIPPLVILANQEMVVFFISTLLSRYFYKVQFSFTQYTKDFFKVGLMAFVIFLALLFSFFGLQQTNPTISSLLFLASPLTTIVLNIFFFKEKLSKQNLIALTLISTGAYILHYLSI